MRRVAAMLLVGCGRLGFDALAPGSDSDTDPAADALSGLVAHFPFEDLGGLTCTGGACPMPGPGITGSGHVFDGVDDCVTFAIGDLPAFTLSAWYKQTAGPRGSVIAKRIDGPNGYEDSWQIETDVNRVSFSTYHGVHSVLTEPSPSVVFGTWQHDVATWDGTTKRLFIDGVERVASPESQGVVYAPFPGLIGCDDNSGVFLYFFAGTIDEVRIYDHAIADVTTIP